MSQHIQTIKVCVLGDGNVGKSALTIRYFQDQFVEDWDPTIEDLYTRKDILNKQMYNLEVQDTAGQQNYSTLRDMYIRESQGFLIIFSVAEQTHNEDGTKKETSFDHVDSYYNNIRQHHTDVPILLVANKIDLSNMRKISTEQVKEKAEQLNIPFKETSAKTNSNVAESFLHVVSECLKNSRRAEEDEEINMFPSSSGNNNQNKAESKKKKKNKGLRKHLSNCNLS